MWEYVLVYATLMEIPARQFLSHIKRRANDDCFPLSLWEVWLCSTLGVQIPDLIGPLQQCPCNAFQINSFGDHLQTCQTKSAATQVHGGVQIWWHSGFGRSQS